MHRQRVSVTIKEALCSSLILVANSLIDGRLSQKLIYNYMSAMIIPKHMHPAKLKQEREVCSMETHSRIYRLQI